MMQTDYLKLIDEYTDEMIAVLQELVRIRSVEAEPVETLEKGLLPFGALCSDGWPGDLPAVDFLCAKRPISTFFLFLNQHI